MFSKHVFVFMLSKIGISYKVKNDPAVTLPSLAGSQVESTYLNLLHPYIKPGTQGNTSGSLSRCIPPKHIISVFLHRSTNYPGIFYAE